MKKINWISLSVLTLFIFSAFKFVEEKEKYPTLEIGAAAPDTDYKMQDVSGKSYSLSDLKSDNGLLVIFSCNSCPFVVGNGEDSEGWEGRYKDISKSAKAAKVEMVLINSNEAKRDGDDSFDKMKARAKDKKYSTKYLMDVDSKLANAFGAKTTPHVFLFDKDMKLIYKGAIDDNVKSSKEVKAHYLKDALKNLKEEKEIANKETKALGCSIKRKSK